MLKENPLLSVISVLGTAFAICMIMIIVIIYEVRNANYQPETKRDRTMYVQWGRAKDRVGDGASHAMLSMTTVKSVYTDLKTPEATTVLAPGAMKLASLPGGSSEEFVCDVLFCDAAFWRVFDFSFIGGKAFTDADVVSGIKQAVISEGVARRLFGTTDVVGKQLLLSYDEFTVCAVVRDVSTLAESSYAQIWAPYSTEDILNMSYAENILGGYRVYMLAKSRNDFEAIRSEIAGRVKEYNATLTDMDYELLDQPDTHFVRMERFAANRAPDIKALMIRYTIVLLVLMLVPAINLSGMTLSRMRKRMAEIGVRKAFGATKGELLGQVLYENLILTLLGGIVGLLLSYGALFLLRGWLLGESNTFVSSLVNGSASVNLEMMLNPMVFVYAFLFCLVLNLLSAGIPAYRASVMNIVEALKDN